MEVRIVQVTGSYHIVRLNGKKYVLKNSSVFPKNYFWGRKTESIRSTIVEVDENEEMFTRNKRVLSPMTIVLMVQPLVYLLYKAIQHFFVTYSISQQLLFKFILFLISIVWGYIIYQIIFAREEESYRKFIREHQTMCLQLQTDGKRHFGLAPFFLIGNMITFVWYCWWQDGGEGSLLILSTLFTIATLTFSLRILPIGVQFQQGQLEFKKLEKLE